MRAAVVIAWLLAGVASGAQAQQPQLQMREQPQQQERHESPARQTVPHQQPGEPGLLEGIGRWLDRQGDNLSSSFKDAGKGVQNFGHEAGVAAQSTVEGAKDAAGAVVRIPAARVVTGHEVCKLAPNGAPDCVAAATAMCKKRGFGSGTSADMTTAEVCPAKVYLAGRNSGPECRTETFVSRALCQ
ncbi:MAG: hypothetical protein JSR61_19600 [Proteobacteria bacterium]|nr:hypothetical protein [Pseudomonadota bacterium]